MKFTAHSTKSEKQSDVSVSVVYPCDYMVIWEL